MKNKMLLPNDETNKKPTKRELWFEDLKTYRRLETWGAGLTFAGIALITQQLAEWSNNPQWVLFTPAIIGLGAFIHLRIINYRGRKVRWQLQPSEVPKCPGWYGRLMAWWPLFLGFASSCFLLKDFNIKIAAPFFLGIICFLVVILVEIVYCLKWEHWQKKQNNTQNQVCPSRPSKTPSNASSPKAKEPTSQ